MPPARISATTQASESNRPRNVSTQKAKKPSKQRKIPKSLTEINFCHYGAKVSDLFNNDATLTANPTPASESVVATSQDTPSNTLYSNSCFPSVPTPANPFYPQIPASEGYLENSTRVMYYGTEPWAYAPIPSRVPFQDEFQPETGYNIPAMSSDPYGRYTDSQVIPLTSSAGNPSMGHVDEPYWFPDMNVNSYSTSSSISNAPMTSTHSGTLYHNAIETGTAGPSHLTMLSNEAMLFFPNDDNPFYYHTCSDG